MKTLVIILAVTAVAAWFAPGIALLICGGSAAGWALWPEDDEVTA